MGLNFYGSRLVLHCEHQLTKVWNRNSNHSIIDNTQTTKRRWSFSSGEKKWKILIFYWSSEPTKDQFIQISIFTWNHLEKFNAAHLNTNSNIQVVRFWMKNETIWLIITYDLLLPSLWYRYSFIWIVISNDIIFTFPPRKKREFDLEVNAYCCQLIICSFINSESKIEMVFKDLDEFVNENSNRNDYSINKVLGAGRRWRIIFNPFEPSLEVKHFPCGRKRWKKIERESH